MFLRKLRQRGRMQRHYVEGENKTEAAPAVEIIATSGVRYTVPEFVHVEKMADKLTVRFRVGAVYKNCYITTYFNDEQVAKRKRPVVAPGEMEQIVLDKEKLLNYPNLKTITVQIEEA